MNMNKSLTAVAVAGALAVPMSAAQAQPEGWYGFIAAGIESSDIDREAPDAGDPGSGPAAIFHTNTGADGEGGTGLADIAASRFGWGGSEDLGNGLEANYQFEWGTDSTTAAAIGNRLSNVGLSGGFGSITLGQQWSALYNYMGWNVFRSVGHGGGAWYYHTSNFQNIAAYGLRSSNTIDYTFGAGPYGDDPFTFTVQAVSNSNVYTTTGGGQDDFFLDGLSLGFQGTAGIVTWNAFYGQEEASGDRTPQIYGLGGRLDLGPALVSATFLQSDWDMSGVNDEPNSIHVNGEMDFGGGFSGRVMVATVDGDDVMDDIDANLFVGLEQALSSRTFIDFEFETIDYDNTGDETVVYLGARHTF